MDARFRCLLVAIVWVSIEFAAGCSVWASPVEFEGHYYEIVVVPEGINWFEARDAAASATFSGLPGHLATANSASENMFIADLAVAAGLHPLWIGGYQDTSAPDYSEPAGGWRWVTGEPWSYESWCGTEPNNILLGEDALELYAEYGGPAPPGTWNDLINDWDLGGYAVEYEAAVSGTVFHDRNANGVRDANESAPNGPITVQLRKPASAADSALPIKQTQAAADGAFCIAVDDVGPYDIAATLGGQDLAMQPCVLSGINDIAVYPQAWRHDHWFWTLRLFRGGDFPIRFRGDGWGTEEREAVKAAVQCWLDVLNALPGVTPKYSLVVQSGALPLPAVTFDWSSFLNVVPVGLADPFEPFSPTILLNNATYQWTRPDAATGYNPVANKYRYQVSPQRLDTQAYVLHELGHVFGLAHYDHHPLGPFDAPTPEETRQRSVMCSRASLDWFQHWLGLGDVIGVQGRWDDYVVSKELTISLGSPADLVVRDSAGRTLSASQAGIPGGCYERWADGVGELHTCAAIGDPTPGFFEISVVPHDGASPEACFSLWVLTANLEIVTVAQDMPIADIPDQPFRVHSTLGYAELEATPDSLWPPNGKLADVQLDYAVSGAAVGDPQLNITCNEGDFDETKDVEIIDSHHIRLRAKRDGRSRDGRIYTITLTLADADGDEAQYESTVTVPHDQRRRAGRVTSAVAARTAHGAQIVVMLTGNAKLSAEVLNIAGRSVCRICTDRGLSSGANTLLWDVKSQYGTRVPAGKYLVRLIARNEDGEQSQLVVPLLIDR